MSQGAPERFPLASGGVEAKEPALVARRLSKHFGGVMALKSLDLDVGAGEVRAIVGENGSASRLS